MESKYVYIVYIIGLLVPSGVIEIKAIKLVSTGKRDENSIWGAVNSSSMHIYHAHMQSSKLHIGYAW